MGKKRCIRDRLDIDLKLGRIDEAKQVAAVLREMTGIFDLWDYCAYLGDFEIATAQKDAAAGMKILEKMLPAMLKKWEPYSSALYSRIPRKENGRNIGSLLMPRILEDLENPEAQDFDFLREVPGLSLIHIFHSLRAPCRSGMSGGVWDEGRAAAWGGGCPYSAKESHKNGDISCSSPFPFCCRP